MTWYMGLNTEGKPNGWDTEPWGDALEVSQIEYDFATLNPDCVWNGTTLAIPAPREPLPPTQEEIIYKLTTALEAYYDSLAQEKRYDNRLTCALRAGYAGPFQAEGTAFAIWMDTCNAAAYQIMADVLRNARPIPTAAELIAELPVLVWPG